MLGDRLPGAGGEGEDQSLFEFWHVNTLLLEIGVLPHHARGVELGGTSAVGVASTHPRALMEYWTCLSH